MNRRQALKVGLTGSLVSVASALGASAQDAGSDKPAFVLVHGAWHGAWCWSEVTQLLADSGFAALAIDLPGSGVQATLPSSFTGLATNMDSFATEVSPIADITQQQRTDATSAAVKAAAKLGNGKVVLVGHSWGGLTVSHVAEVVPELIHSVVYLSAVLVANGVNAFEVLFDESFLPDELGPLLIGNPDETGALRLNTRSTDPAYRKALWQHFCHDVDEEKFASVSNFLTPDEVAGTGVEPMVISAERYGSLSRHYIGMADDQDIRPAGQAFMIKQLDASEIGGETHFQSMAGGHSPFVSQPEKLAEHFIAIAS